MLASYCFCISPSFPLSKFLVAELILIIVKQPGAVYTSGGKTKVNISKMNIQELVEKCVNVSITVEVKDLKHFADYLIEQTKKELEETVISDKAETYPTPSQVSEMLNVDTTTLWRWKKKGYLVPIEVGGKRRYRMSEVKAILNGGKGKTK